MLFRHHRVVERVGLVVELDDRARQHRAFLDPQPLRQRAGGDVADHHLERNDLDFLDQLLAHVEPADEMGRDTHPVEMGEDVLRDAVVEHALAVHHLVLLLVEGGRVVLEELDQRTRLRAFVKDLGLAFVDSAASVHHGLWLPGERAAPAGIGPFGRLRCAPAVSIAIARLAQLPFPANQPVSLHIDTP